MLARLTIFLVFVVAAFASPVEAEEGQIWAVLVAGSIGWVNYRHQADVCHAYQIFRRHGIPDSNIIVMMYDDIARNSENPWQGVIINKPNGPNVYDNVLKDYTGYDVTPQNFLNVLTGNKAAMSGIGSGKVLESGPNDHVFIYFADHGGKGYVTFPHDMLPATGLNEALMTMYQNNMYKKLVFYMEACESGSMFENLLPSDINVFATTSASPSENSWGCYDDFLGTPLGDEYSVSWMEDLVAEEGQEDMAAETLLNQFRRVVKRVRKSHPRMYGQLNLSKDKVIDYVGISNSSADVTQKIFTVLEEFTDSVSSRDVAFRNLERKIERAYDIVEKEKLIQRRNELIAGRRLVDDLFSRIVYRMVGDHQPYVEGVHYTLYAEMMPCYKTIVDHFRYLCININQNTYTLTHLYKFANLCVENESPYDVIKVITEECTQEHKALDGVN